MFQTTNQLYIWVHYNISLIWIKAIWGWFPLLTMIPVRENSEVVIIYPYIIYICIYTYIYIYTHTNWFINHDKPPLTIVISTISSISQPFNPNVPPGRSSCSHPCCVCSSAAGSRCEASWALAAREMKALWRWLHQDKACLLWTNGDFTRKRMAFIMGI